MATVDGFFTTQEVARILRVTASRVSQLKRDNRIKPAKFVGKMPLFPAADIIEFASQPRPDGRPKKTGK